MGLGIVPKLQKAFLRYNWPGPIRKFAESPTGPFTVFFWCSSMKWLITLVNIGDIYIPVERVSSFQQVAMCLSGFVWARYCTQITPVNYMLMAANFFMACIACYQLYRKYDAGQLIE